MNKYKLNFLRWLTRGEIPDDILKKSYGWKFEKDKFKFRFKAKVSTKHWRGNYGSMQ